MVREPLSGGHKKAGKGRDKEPKKQGIGLGGG